MIKRMDNVGIVVDDLKAAIAFFVELGLESDVLARLRGHGAELIGDVVQYEDTDRLCYLRGPEGIIVALAQEIG